MSISHLHLHVCYYYVINKTTYLLTYLSKYREPYTILISRSTVTIDKSAFGSACSTVALQLLLVLYCIVQRRNSETHTLGL